MNRENIVIKRLFLIFSTLLLISIVSAVEVTQNYSANSIVQITSLKYEPYPVNPGEYFDLWISVNFVGYSGAGGAVFELIPEFPFSLDSEEDAVKNYGVLTATSMVLKYKVRVNEDAVEGVNTIKLNYKIGSIWYTKTFDIEIANAQTTFDAIIQDVSDSEVSIAIANTGKITANSVIVKIPEQDDFTATGTDGQMVGNLESGDYSIVSFEISKKMSFQGNPEDKTSEDEELRTMPTSQSSNLTFDIYYTDNIGERRVVTMELPVTLTTTTLATGEMPEGFGRRNSGISIWYIIAGVIIVLGIALFIISKKAPKLFEKIKSPFSKIFKKLFHKKKETPSVPEWMKSAMEKEKK